MKPNLNLVYDRQGFGRVEIRTYFPQEQKNVYLTTGLKLLPEYWDYKRRKPSFECPKKYKKRIADTEQKVADLLHYIVMNSEGIDTFRKKLSTMNNRIYGFIHFMESETKKSSLKPSTKINYEQTLLMLKSFKKEIEFEEINYGLAHNLYSFLTDKYGNTSTVKKHLSIIKKFVLLAVRLKLLDNDQYKDFASFEIPSQKIIKEVLTVEELKKIRQLDINPFSNDVIIRDMFIFSFYTALRISDIETLTKDNFFMKDGNLYLKKEIIKLERWGREVLINLTGLFAGEPEGLIKEYLKTNKEYIFPKFQRSSLSYSLKKIARMAGINKEISFHTARHSSLTYVAEKTGDVFVVMKHGGLTNIATAQKYIKYSIDIYKTKLNEGVF